MATLPEILLSCSRCNAKLVMPENAQTTRCEYCGSFNQRPVATGESLDFLLRGRQMLQDHRYEDAERFFNQVLAKHPDEHEALWGRLMCRYGVEAVQEVRFGRLERRLICHRARQTALRNEGDYLRACELADPCIRAQYEADAEYVDNVQSRIREAVAGKKGYDVFICYKETDPVTGGQTDDSRIARRLYNQYSKSFRVFFAPYTLKDKFGEDYEAEIFHAIYTAKVMLVVGLKPEHFNATWPRSEWTRFMENMQSCPDRLLIPIYGGRMTAEDLPMEFLNMQWQGLCINNQLNYIEDIENELRRKLSTKPKAVANSGEVRAYLQRAVGLENAVFACENMLGRIDAELGISPADADIPQVQLPPKPEEIKAKYPEKPVKRDIAEENKPVKPERRTVPVPQKPVFDEAEPTMPEKPSIVLVFIVFLAVIGFAVLFFGTAENGGDIAQALIVVGIVGMFGLGLGFSGIKEYLQYPTVLNEYQEKLNDYQERKKEYLKTLEADYVALLKQHRESCEEAQQEYEAALIDYRRQLQEYEAYQASDQAEAAVRYSEELAMYQKEHQRITEETRRANECRIAEWQKQCGEIRMRRSSANNRLNDTNRVHKELSAAIKPFREEIARLGDRCRRDLETHYASGKLYPTYQGMIPVCQMYDYVASGLCTDLEGAGGAYAQYMSDLRSGQLTDNLADVRARVAEAICRKEKLVDKNQYTLFGGIYNAMDAVVRTTGEIRSVFDALQAYQNEIVAIAQRSKGFSEDISSELDALRQRTHGLQTVPGSNPPVIGWAEDIRRSADAFADYVKRTSEQ